MPVYTYRREDGSTFDVRQSFHDEPLTTDPENGQKVWRIVQGAGVIFKGSGFYVNDSKNASKKSVTSSPSTKKEDSTPSKPASSAAAD
jgi:putative FmdB family regulatory protein